MHNWQEEKKTNEEFVKEIYNLVGDEYTFLENYINVKTKIKCKHNKYNYEWYITPYSFYKEVDVQNVQEK